MDMFFQPDGVAVIGATDTPGRGGYHILHNALTGYKGRIYPVNPRLSSILGQRCYHAVDAIPDNFELAVYFIPARFLPETIEKCARKGVKGIIIESAGFAEAGAEGRIIQERSAALAHSLGIRLWGPNCMGYLDAYSRNAFTFFYSNIWDTLLFPGNVALVVQSGMLSAGFLMMVLERGGMGMSKICSIGNKCDVDETELLEYLIADPHTAVIGFYVESIPRGRRFFELARGTDKTIIVLKGGRSAPGAQAALSHTASLAGDPAVFSAACGQAGIVEVRDITELSDFCRGFSHTRRVNAQSGAAVCSFSGGGAIVGTDLLAEHGMRMAGLQPQTLRVLKEVFPPWMEPGNPVDLWPAIELHGHARVMQRATEALMRDSGVNALMVQLIPAMLQASELEALARLKNELGKPVAAWLVGMDQSKLPIRKALEDMGLPVFDELGRAAAFLAAAKKYGPSM